MSVEIRDWTAADFAGYARLRTWYDPLLTRETLERMFKGDLGHLFLKRVAVDGARLVGQATVVLSVVSGQPMLSLVIEREYRGRGLGRDLLGQAIDSVEGRRIATWCYDDDERDLRFAERNGFDIINHGISSTLMAADVDMTPVVSEFPITVFTDTELDDDLAARVSDLMIRSATNPETTQLGWSVDVAKLRKFMHNCLWVVAFDGDKPIAMSNVEPFDSKPWLVGYTCVDEDYRGRGLSHDLKQTLHLAGLDRGAPGFETENEATNHAIRALNASLGYKVSGGTYRLVRPGT